MKMNRSGYGKGFTIVELLVVVAIISVLLGIVSVAAQGALRNGRTKRADAMCRVLEQAIAAYYAKVGQWPDVIEKKSGSMNKDSTWTFSTDDTDTIFQDIVRRSVGANATMPLVDASALFVADKNKLKKNGEGCYDSHGDSSLKTFCGNQHCANGADFSAVSRRNSKGHIPLSRMAFGYAATVSGKFSRYWITYNAKTDSVSVTRKNPKYDGNTDYPKDWE